MSISDPLIWCVSCKTHHKSSHHWPEFEIVCAYHDIGTPGGDPSRKVHAPSPEAAATRWAEEFDADGDYTIVQGSSEDVEVYRDGKLCGRYQVSGESVPEYSAIEILKETEAS